MLVLPSVGVLAADMREQSEGAEGKGSWLDPAATRGTQEMEEEAEEELNIRPENSRSSIGMRLSTFRLKYR